ncbi:bifunctional aconitate hydratase 2/2-methylisocitrate dehydratase [Salmonella enterica subsp. enterica]|uniref:Bifunctional aconitate hydratase 2/2-methylisocitrate dehydratase n=1 Tax=Salmonella enterica I TaxID=59201 RepID=A0A3S4LMR1_SALET|nr:bifunctional aconitate hydratase 2/2-methylisocitrate dehydratase [Salmonella enterica subsp. enterica]
MQSWADAEWFLSRPPLAEKITVTVFQSDRRNEYRRSLSGAGCVVETGYFRYMRRRC